MISKGYGFVKIMTIGVIGITLLIGGIAVAKPNTLNRSEIPDKYKWDLSQIYTSWDAWETDLTKLQS